MCETAVECQPPIDGKWQIHSRACGMCETAVECQPPTDGKWQIHGRACGTEINYLLKDR